MDLQFKQWLEAIFDPMTTKRYVWNSGDRKYLGNSFNLKIDKNGRVSPMEKEDWNNNIPHFEIHPREKRILLQGMSPQAPDFRKFINAIRSKYHDVDDWQVEVMFAAMHQQTGRSNWYRNVGYWMKQNTVDLNNRLPEYFYHGTCTNLWYTDIKRKGLLPRGMSGSSGSYGAQNVDSLSQASLVYLSTHPDAAAREAARQAAKRHGGRPLILKVTTHGLFPNKFHPDEDAVRRRGNFTAQDSVRVASILGYEGKIGPSLLEPFLIGKESQTDRGLLYAKWEKFKDVPLGEHPMTNKLRDGNFPYQGDPEWYALKDAGILGDEEYDTNWGKQTRTVLKKHDFTDEDIRGALKANWTQNVKAIVKELDNGYRSPFYYFHSDVAPKNLDKLSPEDEKTLKHLLDSGFVLLGKRNDGRSWWELRTYRTEEYAIRLAKLLGKKDFRQFKADIEHLVDSLKKLKESEYARVD